MTERTNNNEEEEKPNSSILSPPRWKGARSLALVQQLNERCLDLLSQVAASTDEDCSLALIGLHRDLWRNLNVLARQRAASLPFVIVDIHFTDIAWWQQVREAGRNTPNEGNGAAYLPREIAEELMHETLMFVWHAAQSDTHLACSTVGMSRDVSTAIAGMTAQEIRDIASKHSGEMVPRWRDRIEWWQALLIAAQRGSETALADIHLHAKLLLTGELLAADS